MQHQRLSLWRPTIIVFLGGAIATALVPLAVPILGPLTKEFGIPAARLGWIVSFPSLLCAFGALLFGLMIDRIGDTRVLLAGAVLAFVGDLGVALAPHLSWLYAARLFQGISYGSLSVAGPAFIQRTIAGDTRRAAMALWAAHTPTGFALAMLGGAQIVAVGLSWRYSFFGHAAAAVLIGLAMLSLRSIPSQVELRRSFGTRQVLASPKVYAVAVAALASALLQTGTMVALPTLLATQLGVPAKASALIVVLGMIAVWGGAMVIVTTRVRQAPRRALPITAMIGAASSVAIFSRLPASIAPELACVLLFSLAIGAANSLIWSLMPLVAPSSEAAGATAGVITQGSFIGVLTGPPLFFLLIHQSGWAVGGIGAVLGLLMVTALAALKA